MAGPSSGHPYRAFLGMPHSLRAPSPFVRSLPIPRLANTPAAANGDDGGGGGDGPVGPELPLVTLQPAPPTPLQVQVQAQPVVLGPTRMGRKMGRPRKYLPALAPPLSSVSGSGMGLGSPTQMKRRGRPPGSGRKQRLSFPGQWVTSSPGRGFTIHVIKIEGGQDITMKIISFAQQGPRAICVMSASGVVSTVTLRQPATSGGTATYEGRYEIIFLSGSYLLSDVGKSHDRSGGLSICLSSPEGHVLGGCVVGQLKAAGPVQVIIGAFIHDPINEEKKKANTSQDELEFVAGDNTSAPSSAVSVQNLTPAVWEWPGSMQTDLNSGQSGIHSSPTRGYSQLAGKFYGSSPHL